MKREKVPLLLTWIKGAVGKQFVIKHYKYGPIKTKFPDMTKIIASNQQRKCRNLFKEAVAYAKIIMADPVKKKEWQKKSKHKHRVFNLVIKEYMLTGKKLKEQRLRIGARMIRSTFKIISKNESICLGSLCSFNRLPDQVNIDTG